MGWTYTHKQRGQSVKDFFRQEFNHEYGEVIDVAQKGYTEAYVAYRIPAHNKFGFHYPERVIAIMCCIRYTRDYYNFGYKDMDETMHPYYYNCPERILKLLTPTDNTSAWEWRQTCWEKINKRKARPKLKVGDKIKFKTPLNFTNGDKISEFIVTKVRPFRLKDANSPYNFPYRLRHDTLEWNPFELIKG